MHTQITERNTTFNFPFNIHDNRNGVSFLEQIGGASAYILTRSPSLRIISVSLLRGEKWHTQLLTETLVGKAIPENNKEIGRAHV